MAKNVVDVLTKERIKSNIINCLSNSNNISREVLVEYVLKQLQQDLSQVDVSAYKAKTLAYQAQIGILLKQLAEEEIIDLSKPKSAKAIVTLINPPTTYQPEKPVSNLIDMKKICIEAKNVILQFLSLNAHQERKTTIISVIKLMGVTLEDLQDKTSGSKATLYKSVVGAKIHELLKTNEIVLTTVGKNEYLSLANPIANQKANKKENTNKESKITKLENHQNKINNELKKRYEEYQKKQQDFATKQKETVLKFLCELDAKVFEKLSVDLICKLYDVDTDNGQVIGGVSDRGIDGYVIVKDPMGFPPKKLAIQAKCFKDSSKTCAPTVIRQFYGAMASESYRKGFVITTGKYDISQISKHCANDDGTYAKVEKSYKNQNDIFGKNERMIICIDGKTLVDYMIKYRLGINFSLTDEIIDVDLAYFKKL